MGKDENILFFFLDSKEAYFKSDHFIKIKTVQQMEPLIFEVIRSWPVGGCKQRQNKPFKGDIAEMFFLRLLSRMIAQYPTPSRYMKTMD